MALHFTYALPATGGKPKPTAQVVVHGPNGQSREIDAVLDTGSDLTIFPHWLAAVLGIPLDERDAIEIGGIGRDKVKVCMHLVDLELSSASGEQHRWQAGVGFTLDTEESLLGHHGCLQYFDATFYGAREIVELTWNGSCKDFRLSTG